MKALPFVVILIGLGLIVPVQAEHGCNGTVTEIDTGSHRLYVDDRTEQSGEANHWIYLEFNAVEGLQSGGSMQDILQEWPSFPDPCAHADPDVLVAVIWL